MNYMQRVMIASKVCTPTTAGNELRFGGLNKDYNVYGMDICVQVAGAQATHKIEIYESDGTTLVATITVGTSAAGTVKEVRVAENKVLRTAGTHLILKSAVNDATASYYVRIWGSIPLD